MSLPPLIAFAGRAGSGKTTAAETLIDQGFALVKFADPLKDMMRAFYASLGLEPEQIERRIEGDRKEEPDPHLGGKTPRMAMQTLGTEWGRDLIHKDLWVKAWAAKVTKLRHRGIPVVVDDCRFPNEARRVRILGGKIVKITGRSGGLAPVHASEGLRFVPDEVIANTGPKEDFERMIRDRYGLVVSEDEIAEMTAEEIGVTVAAHRQMSDEEFQRALDGIPATDEEFEDDEILRTAGETPEDGRRWVVSWVCETPAEMRRSLLAAGWPEDAIEEQIETSYGPSLADHRSDLAESIEDGPLAEIWNARRRADVTPEEVQQAVRVTLNEDQSRLTELVQATRHLDCYGGLTQMNKAELTVMLFYADCIKAGLGWQPELYDGFLNDLGIDTPVPL